MSAPTIEALAGDVAQLKADGMAAEKATKRPRSSPTCVQAERPGAPGRAADTSEGDDGRW